jgi:uncharacterized protein (TIGR03067 family)
MLVPMPMVRAGLTLAVLATVAATARAQDDDALKGPLKRMQGTWSCQLVDGPEGTMTITGDKVVVKLPGMDSASTITIDRKAMPWHADFKITEGDDDIKGQTALGILKREGKGFVIAAAAPGMDRPTDFEPIADEVFVFKLLEKQGDNDDETAAKKDMKALQGAWTSPLGEGEAKWVIDGDKLALTTPRRDYKVTFTLDPDAKPHPSIDFKVEDGPEEARGKTLLGIYKIEDGAVTICIDGGGDTRPTEFSTEPGQRFSFDLKKSD